MDGLSTRYQNPSDNNSLNKSTSIKAPSSLKNKFVDKQDTSKPAGLNIFENNRESKNSGHRIILYNIIFYCCRLLTIIFLER